MKLSFDHLFTGIPMEQIRVIACFHGVMTCSVMAACVAIVVRALFLPMLLYSSKTSKNVSISISMRLSAFDLRSVSHPRICVSDGDRVGNVDARNLDSN